MQTGNELSSLTWSHDLVFQFYQLSNIQQDSIAEKDERLGNVSRQLQSLQMQNRRLIETLQHVAVKLCRELYNKSGGEHAPLFPNHENCSIWTWISHLGNENHVFFRSAFPSILINSLSCIIMIRHWVIIAYTHPCHRMGRDSSHFDI